MKMRKEKYFIINQVVNPSNPNKFRYSTEYRSCIWKNGINFPVERPSIRKLSTDQRSVKSDYCLITGTMRISKK